MHRTKTLRFILSVAVLGAAAIACRRTPPVSVEPKPFAEPVTQHALTGKVVAVADGDTVTVLDADNAQHRIRLSGIDAPESHQAFGARAKQNLSALVFGRDITVLYSKTDQYGRLVGKLIVEGQDANLAQVKAGLAWHYKEYQREQSPEDREFYARAEEEARAQHLGLWQDPNPIEPSQFRREQREERRGKSASVN